VIPVLVFASATVLTGAAAPSDEVADQAALAALAARSEPAVHPNCETAPPGHMRCHSYVVDSAEDETPAAAPKGLGAADLQAAYGYPKAGGQGKIIALVDAYDAPNAEQDLAAYRTQFGLPPCSSQSGCFQKVDQRGGTTYPAANSGWQGEIMLDLDMASAGCPDCKILLVEADDSSGKNLGEAVNTAAKLGASAISNSYGGGEDTGTASTNTTYYTHPGVLITASTGDHGYGASFPASGDHVLAVGGTSLTKATSSRGWAEAAWSGGGSGCSKYVGKPSYQSDTGCTKRMEADVAAVADPKTGVAVYNGGKWGVVGGTSASAPLVAAIFTVLGLNGIDGSFPYENKGAFYDVTSGSNGTCTTAYECNAQAGYDGPTGMGTPDGAALAKLSGDSDAGGGSSGGGDSDAGGEDAAPGGADQDAGGGGVDAGVGSPSGGDSGVGAPPSGSDAGGSPSPGNGGSEPPVDTGAPSAGDSGPTAGGSDNGLQPAASQGANGCGCAVPGGAPPFGGASVLWVIGAAAVGRRRRRRS
jgi:hypothetical protein